MGLKREGGGYYKVPTGGWFELVSCPNCFGEMEWAWMGSGDLVYGPLHIKSLSFPKECISPKNMCILQVNKILCKDLMARGKQAKDLMTPYVQVFHNLYRELNTISIISYQSFLLH